MKKLKKMITVLSVAIVVATTIPMSTPAATYPVCSVDGCNRTSNHLHNGTWYCGHSMNDGHDYHAICSVSGCNRTSTHTHSGTSYMGHHRGDGHGHYSSSRGNGRHHGNGHH